MSPYKWAAKVAKTARRQQRESKAKYCKTPTVLPEVEAVIRHNTIGAQYNIGGQGYVLTDLNQYYHGTMGTQYQMRFVNNEPRYTLVANPITPTYYGTNSMTISQQTNAIWTNHWNNAYTANNITTITNPYAGTDITWSGWIQDLNGQQVPLPQVIDQAVGQLGGVVGHRDETPEQRQIRLDQEAHQRALQREEAARRNEERRVIMNQAHDRALATFVESLSPEERESFEKERCIYVRSQHGRRYRIKCGGGQSGNVDLLDHHGQRQASFCVHPGYQPGGFLLPNPDAWLTQKLFLEYDEDHFIERANMTFGQRPQLGRSRRLHLPGRNVGNVGALAA